MKAKAYVLIMIAVIGGLASGYGLVCGYFASSSAYQNQVDTLQFQVVNLETTVTTLQSNYLNLQKNYTQLLILYSDLFLQQAQSQVRIDSVAWDISRNSTIIVIRNIGNAAATIESISVRKNASDSIFYSQSYTSGNSINTGETISLIWTVEGASAPASFLEYLTEYVIRVTTTAGLQYELITTSPMYR